MTPQINDIWVYLSASPLLGLTVTLLAYQAAFWLYRRSGMNPLANPVLIAVSILVLLLTLTATSYETYFAGAQFVHFLLGPATVALAIPLYTQFRRVRSLGRCCLYTHRPVFQSGTKRLVRFSIVCNPSIPTSNDVHCSAFFSDYCRDQLSRRQRKGK